MFWLGGGDEAKRMRDTLLTLFRSSTKAPIRRRLTSPGGVVDDAPIYWVDLEHERGIWAHFWSPPKADDNRWGCSFGVNLGRTEGEALVPAVEINLPKAFDLRPAGRVLIDENKRLYLGHRGGLGGGRSGNMPVEEFTQRIRGYVREEFAVPDRHGMKLAFLIAAADDPDLIHRLYRYVSECTRLRLVNRAEANEPMGVDKKLMKPKRIQEDVFSPEIETDGVGAGSGERNVTRLHGSVLNALQRLVPGAVNNLRADMRPDLYLLRCDRMSTLFEVKASSDTQSWFTAIGQLLVYSNGQEPPPRLVFVCPAERRHPAFRSALERLGIYLVTFAIEKRGHISFSGLDSALEGIFAPR